MTDEEAYKQLKDKAPTGYRLNELIQFSYPVRKIAIRRACKQATRRLFGKSLQCAFACNSSGFSSQDKLFTFLGLGQTDEFVLRELFALREKGLLIWFPKMDCNRRRRKIYSGRKNTSY
jgi:hypothetical protein